MHILTKVFVLIASILSVVMASLAVSYAANANAIKSDYFRAVSAQQAAEGSLASANDWQIRINTQMEKNTARLHLEKTNLEETIRTSEAEISALSIELRQARASRDSLEGKIAQLGVTTQTQVELIKEYKGEVSRLRDGELTWRSQKLDLEAKLSDSQSQLGVFAQVNRSLTELLAEAQAEIASDDDVDDGTGVATVVPGEQVRGTVQQVREEHSTGDLIIRISLGTNDRIAENSKLYLNRDGETYLGDVVIFQTDPNFAIGRVRNLQPGQEIRVDDQVWSSLGN